jgi:hypothetical protein
MHLGGIKSCGLKPKQEGNLTKLKGQASGVPTRKPSPVTTKKLGKPNGLHGGGTVRRSLMYQAVSDS